MEYKKLYQPMMTVFNEDIKTNKGPSHITDLIIISIKSLVPSNNYVRVSIDYKRYSEEIKLWKDYRHGDNPSLLNLFNDIDSKIYWEEIDNSIYPRILPIIMVNKDFTFIKEEVIKNVLFTTGNIETLIEAILISKIIFLLMEEEINIIEKLKEEVINLSQIEFERDYGKFYRFPTKEYGKNFVVSFEQQKVFALSVLNFSSSQGFQVLKDCLEVLLLNNIGTTIMGKCIGAFSDDKLEEGFDLDYYEELSLYLYRLRKGKIAPEALKIDKYYLPDIFQFNEGEEFYHSLLNKCVVIKKEELRNGRVVHLNTKSGIYRFEK